MFFKGFLILWKIGDCLDFLVENFVFKAAASVCCSSCIPFVFVIYVG